MLNGRSHLGFVFPLERGEWRRVWKQEGGTSGKDKGGGFSHASFDALVT